MVAGKQDAVGVALKNHYIMGSFTVTTMLAVGLAHTALFSRTDRIISSVSMLRRILPVACPSAM